MGTGSRSSKRKKKRSQKRSKKRSKNIREKTKKLKRRHDSVSCSDDDNSASTSSVSRSDSNSDDNYRSRRRARSHNRRDARKGSKKKIKRDSSMNYSSVDSHRVKKRKNIKRKRDFESKKKCHGEKCRSEPSGTSSGRSRSHSTFEHNNDSAGELKRKKHKLVMKEKDWEEMGGERIRSRRSRYSSRSCSPCSLQSESRRFDSEERAMEENPPKRLKSVIVVVKETEEAEDGEANKDERKEEIVYEHDDYPSRSNDSNDGMSRGEPSPISHDASDYNTIYLEEPNREAGSSDVRTSELLRIHRLDEERTGGTASSFVEFGVGSHLRGNRSEVSVADVSSNSVALEAMLRQKALQNLLKRQGKLPTKIDGGNEAEHHCGVKNPNGGRSFESEQKVGSIDDVRRTSIVYRLQKDSLFDPQIRKLETGHPAEDNASANHVISRPKLGVLTPTRRLLGSTNTWRRDPTSQNSPRPNLPTPKETVEKDFVKGIESECSDTKMVTEKAERASAAELPASGVKSTKDETNEAHEDSEFEQKTMTVMRGGELVQVSYKVKIPKKAPAFARRQLRRQS